MGRNSILRGGNGNEWAGGTDEDGWAPRDERGRIWMQEWARTDREALCLHVSHSQGIFLARPPPPNTRCRHCFFGRLMTCWLLMTAIIVFFSAPPPSPFSKADRPANSADHLSNDRIPTKCTYFYNKNFKHISPGKKASLSHLFGWKIWKKERTKTGKCGK
jgi:hypothetical protein